VSNLVPQTKHPLAAISRERPAPSCPDDFPHKVDVRKLHALSEAQNHRCAYCGIRVVDGDKWDGPSRDHFVPRASGGCRHWGNEVMACILCNHGRGCMPAMRYFEMVQRHGRRGAWKRARRIRQARQKEGLHGPH
jgi:hypothetical protein